MSVITIFSGTFCKEEPVVKNVLSSTGYKLLTDNDIVAEASRLSGMPANKIMKAFSAKESVFNNFVLLIVSFVLSIFSFIEEGNAGSTVGL